MHPLVALDEATLIKGAGERVLDRVSLSIREGEHTAILGPNGSGKSSLIKMIAMLHFPVAREDGSSPIKLFGRERWNVFDLRRKLGIVSADLEKQFASADLRNVCGLDAVVSGFFATYTVPPHVSPAMWADARRALAEVGALHLAGKSLQKMSTGEGRRILIARALVQNPAALLLDEPTSGLDLLAAHQFLGTVRTLAQRGRTLILVTHHVEEVVPEIERIILLRDGRIFRDGRRADVLTSESMSELYSSSVSVRSGPDGYFRSRIARGAAATEAGSCAGSDDMVVEDR